MALAGALRVKLRLRDKTPPPALHAQRPLPAPSMALGGALTGKRRLREKTPPPGSHPQRPLPAPLELESEAPQDSKLKAYLITLPRPKPGTVSSLTGRPLVAPGSKTKAEVLACLLDAFANPHYTSWNGSGPVKLSRLGVWREFHAPVNTQARDEHDHVPALGEQSFRYLPVKRALLLRHDLASHWSCTHAGYWSCVRYCVMASPKKPKACLDLQPELWPKDGSNRHPPVQDCCYPPVTASAIDAKRQKVVCEATERGKAEPKINDLDVWALVVRAGFRNTPDDRSAHVQLAAYAKQHCGEAMVHYLFRRRNRLPQLIDDIWQWECVEMLAEVGRRSRLEALRAAADAACVCQGRWLACVTAAFVQNGINIAEVCHDVLDALTKGRSESVPVMVFGGRSGGEGKSIFLKPLQMVFEGEGMVFNLPEEGNFALRDLPIAKVVFLDDFRFDADRLSWSTLDTWFDGSPVPIGQPQNIPGVTGNITYKGTAPIFITTKLSDLENIDYWAQVNPATNEPWDAEASMLRRRMKLYVVHHKIPKSAQSIRYCKQCVAKLMFSQAAIFKG